MILIHISPRTHSLQEPIYNSWWQVLINYAIALLAAIIFLRPAVANKIKLINHD